MKIKELRLKNFGKFINKEIHFSDGMNVILLTPERWSQSIKTILERTDTFTERLRPRDAG